jgi:hypothetical protein
MFSSTVIPQDGTFEIKEDDEQCEHDGREPEPKEWMHKDLLELVDDDRDILIH